MSDHKPLLVEIKSTEIRTVLESRWVRDLSKVQTSDFESALQCYDWSPIYSMTDPDDATEFLTKNVLSALDKVAPAKLIKFRPDKPALYLEKDTLKK